jgi:hypothetical protein
MLAQLITFNSARHNAILSGSSVRQRGIPKIGDPFFRARRSKTLLTAINDLG